MRIKILIVLLFAIIASPAFANSTNFYVSDGSYQGAIQSAGPKNNFIFGRGGDYVGSTAKAGNSTYYYGSDGAYIGSLQPIGNIPPE